MTKDVKNDKSPEKGKPVPHLEDRRARKGGDYADEKVAPQRPLSEDAFHETLARYCRRFQKDGRDFCLASVTVLEYKQANDKERDLLDKAVVGVLYKQLRAEDRICFIQPAHYLILLPSSQLEEANAAILRVTELISQSRIKQKNSQMQLSASSKIVSAQQKAPADKGLVDPETLYNTVGYTLNAKGKLLSLKENEEVHSEPLFRGDLEGWMERYSPAKISGTNASSTPRNTQIKPASKEPHSKRFHDKWSGDAVVELRELIVPNFGSRDGDTATACSASSANLLRRLRILQNLDHPGINKLADFYADGEGRLLLVNRMPDGIELTNESLNGKKSSSSLEVNAPTLISWLQQILGALIAMQSLVPPVVPSSFDGIKIYYCDTDSKDGGQIVLCNFDSDYLLSSAQVNGQSGGHTSATGQQQLIDGIVDFILEWAQRCEQTPEVKEVVNVLKKLDANSKSTPYKFRSYLKKFVEERDA